MPCRTEVAWSRYKTDTTIRSAEIGEGMDTAVALVQAYLHVNGYFTVVEFPVLETFVQETVSIF